MLDKKLEPLLETLSCLEYRTAKELSEQLQISEKTARSRIQSLNRLLAKNGAQILSRRKLGYRLEITDPGAFRQFQNLKDEKNVSELPVDSQERTQYILAFLLNREDYIKLDDMCDFMYISRSTLTSDLKKAEYILNQYNLKLERRPNYGIRIQGNEFQKRICIANSILKWNSLHVSEIKKQQDMQVIGNILLTIFLEDQIQISEISFISLATHIYVAIGRMRRCCPVHMESEQVSDKIQEHTRKVADRIAVRIQEQFQVTYTESEILYIALHLETKIYSGSRQGKNIVISSEIDALVLNMLQLVYTEFRIDLRDNFEVRMLLNQHMVPMDIRMQYGIPLKNPLLDQIKQEHPMAYTIAVGSCSILKEHYQKEIPEAETGYLAIIFALALTKQNDFIHKKNIVLVCISGKNSSQLFVYRYKKSFGKYINQIYDCNIIELETFDFIGKQIDYVFTTVPIQFPVPVPVFEVDLFFEQNDVVKFSEMFEKNSYHILKKYYRKELFIEKCSCTSKDEVIRALCDRAGACLEVPDDLYEAILKREQMAHTDFGNLIAIPHPYKVMCQENFVVVAILEKPIWWEMHEVQVVFLIALAMETDPDTEQFYELTTDFLFDKERIDRLIQEPSYESLMKLLNEIP